MTEMDFAHFQHKTNNDIEAHRAYADYLYRHGQFKQAIEHFKITIELSEKKQLEQHIDDYSRVTAALYAAGQHEEALPFAKKASELRPNLASLHCNYGILLHKTMRYKEAITSLKKAIDIDPNFVSALDALTHLHYKIDKEKIGLEYGIRALNVKAEQAEAKKNMDRLTELLRGPIPTINKPIPPFDTEHPEKNIIAFGLWGKDPKYGYGAVVNSQLAQVIYAGWTCRFYCEENMDESLLKALSHHGAQVVKCKVEKAFYPLGWRFRVSDDQSVDRFLIRDCDSLINCQERVAVDEWVQSKKHFHLMRDWYSHSELILAGMWGGVANVLPSLEDCYHRFFKGYNQERTIDQHFLRYCVWPLIKDHTLTHDPYFHFGTDVRDFPKLGHFPNNKYHVGQNWFAAHGSPLILSGGK